MINLLISKNNNPAYNLAIEEYLTYNYKSDNPTLFIWQNNNTIVVGRNQNTYAEINIKEAMKDGVNIIRRNTGGGTVFQDMGNVCYSLIVNNDKNTQVNFSSVLKPIINYLKSEGLNAYFSGRNDVEIDGYKVSGNAQLKTSEKVLQHGTLLFDVDLSKIVKYLNVDLEKIKHQKVKSKPARVANIKNLLAEINKNYSLETFVQNIIESYVNNEQINWIDLNQNDLNLIDELFKQKYSKREWTFAKNEDFELSKKSYLETKGLIDIKLNIDKGEISSIKIYGDFLGYLGTEKLEQALTNISYEYNSILEVLKKFNIKEIFGENFVEDDILNLIL